MIGQLKPQKKNCLQITFSKESRGPQQYTEFLKCQMLDKRVQQDGERVFIVLD